MVNNDVWHEVLVRVDSYIIFDCILVCKTWLEVITCPGFRQSYQKIWKTNSKPVGFTTTRHWACDLNLLATSKLGRIMDENKSTQLPRDFFITKSGEGDGLILYGSPSQDTLYVSKVGENRPIRLHIPANMDGNRPIWSLRRPDMNVPKRFSYMGIAILSQLDSYKVIMVGKEFYSYKVMIQTYSSSTGEWQVSEPATHSKFVGYLVGPGTASSHRGVVYWPGVGSVASYDTNNGIISTIHVQDSLFRRRVSCGLCPEGYLQCVTSSVWGSEPDFFLGICKLDDDDDDDDDDYDDDERAWKDIHSVDSDSIPDGVSFVSLVPGRSDCIFVKSAGVSPQLFLYNFHTQELEPICLLSDERWDDGANEWAPLTMADLGVWPSSPFSDTTKSNINTVKWLLAWDHDGTI